ncbi:MAG: NifB/NifX family molybdenum-iron cluster-binding protein [Candidatus Omnitrophica bacterium]|nr:NifB/NifX family molybdenum-iron cluster-binding protein [Candidatus Omnitrophota bacterium]
MRSKEASLLIVLALVVAVLGARMIYEHHHPVMFRGSRARLVAIASTGTDMRSPVSFLFGRAPFFAVCDRATEKCEMVPNPYMDGQHASGLKAAQMLVKKGVDAVCANQIGFEPVRTFNAGKVAIYTDMSGSVWDTLRMFPDGLTRITEQNVPSHFGITGSKTPIACSSFDAQANVSQIVQGQFWICPNCDWRKTQTGSGGAGARCPRCGGSLLSVTAVTAPSAAGVMKPQVRVF